MSSYSYASYLASREESAQHIAHIYEFQELFTMICKEQIEEYLNSRIEPMINEAVNKAVSNAFSGAMQGVELDVARILDITIQGIQQQYHSKEVDKFFGDAIAERLRNELSNIDIKLILS